MAYSDYARICKILGDETRIKIFDMLKKGKLTARKVLEKFNITQPTLSYHMKMLTESGLVNAQKDGRWTYYSISQAALKDFLDFLKTFFNNAR
ncbi:MAG: winged helix-turn-helix transcriptional regulator [Clostridiales bacterium]|mgnify:CR=1 FL=1|jgi:ArsR family transcriptional regulator|nr:winged helix-turn-helix transcriptional regulator [Clostridiales bacterium]